jgi:ketosteroid isomerase-like protein
MRLLIALSGCVISFAVPSIAQEKDAVDPEAREQIEAVVVKFGNAFNKHDAAAIAALYTQTMRLQSWWSESDLGQQAIEKS